MPTAKKASKKTAERRSKKMVPDEQQARFTVRVPFEAADEIDRWATAARIKRSTFLSTALAIGARKLALELVPWEVLSENQVAKFMELVKENPELAGKLGL